MIFLFYILLMVKTRHECAGGGLNTLYNVRNQHTYTNPYFWYEKIVTNILSLCNSESSRNTLKLSVFCHVMLQCTLTRKSTASTLCLHECSKGSECNETRGVENVLGAIVACCTKRCSGGIKGIGEHASLMEPSLASPRSCHEWKLKAGGSTARHEPTTKTHQSRSRHDVGSRSKALL